MAFTGSGQYFAYDGLIAQAGNLADGSLSVGAGSFAFSALDVGLNQGSGPATALGTVTLETGAAVALSIPASAGGVVVGRSFDLSARAEGRLSLSSGSTLAITALPGVAAGAGYDTLNIGTGPGGLGSVTLEGAGTALSLTGASATIRVGSQGGQGSLTVSGGTVESFLLRAGDGSTGAGSKGNVSLTGADSHLTLGAAGTYLDPSRSGLAGGAVFGLGQGDGVLTLTGGATLTAQNTPGNTDGARVIFGEGAGSYGYGLISGGARLTVGQEGTPPAGYTGGRLVIGAGGTGNLMLTAGGVAAATGPDNQIFIGAGGTLTLAGGHIEGALALTGRLVLSPGELTTERIAGPLAPEGGTIALEINGFAPGQADRLIFDTPQSFALTDLNLDFDLPAETFFLAGATAEIGTFTSPFAAAPGLVESSDGRSFDLIVEEDLLLLRARQGTPLSFREDGGLAPVRLPGVADQLATPPEPSPLSLPEAFDFLL